MHKKGIECICCVPCDSGLGNASPILGNYGKLQIFGPLCLVMHFEEIMNFTVLQCKGCNGRSSSLHGSSCSGACSSWSSSRVLPSCWLNSRILRSLHT